MRAPGETQKLIGRVLGGQFRLERLLDRGGMGEVYLAEQLEVERRVVIKLLNAPQFADPKLEERFKQEARALAQLNHPNVVHMYSFGRTDDGLAYLAMEYIEGHTLGSLIAEVGALPEAIVRSILEQLCEALIEAHRRGVIHRDLKPENVMLVTHHDHPERPTLVKVLDFGIAKLTTAADVKLTLHGEIIGTPLYMAPEQLRAAEADARSDIYALGVIGYELATGQVPFEAQTTMELFGKVLHQPVPSLHEIAPDIPVSAALEALLLRCLAKDPKQRYQSASELRSALSAVAQEPWQPLPAASQRPQRMQLSAAADEHLQLSIFDTSNAIAAWRTSRRRWRTRTVAVAGLLLTLTAAVAAASWFDVLPLPEPGLLFAAQPEAATEQTPPAGPLALREWVQGIPFPAGTEYATFKTTLVDAHVPASPERVAEFYREHLGTKWGGFRELADGLTFVNPDAPVEKLTVTPFHDGSRIVITRRQLARK